MHLSKIREIKQESELKLAVEEYRDMFVNLTLGEDVAMKGTIKQKSRELGISNEQLIEWFKVWEKVGE